jgi:hypothetical protein
MSNPHTEILSVPLDVGMAGVCDDSTMTGILKVGDDTKVVETIAGLVVVDVINRASGVFPANNLPRDPVGGILTTIDLDLHVHVSPRDRSSPVTNVHANSRFHLPVKPTRYDAVVEELLDVVRYLFHTRIIPLIG